MTQEGSGSRLTQAMHGMGLSSPQPWATNMPANRSSNSRPFYRLETEPQVDTNRPPAQSVPMKTFTKLSLSALIAAALVSPAVAQLQIAGNLQVSVDAVTQPVGAVTFITNNAVAGGVFQSITNAGVGPQ